MGAVVGKACLGLTSCSQWSVVGALANVSPERCGHLAQIIQHFTCSALGTSGAVKCHHKHGLTFSVGRAGHPVSLKYKYCHLMTS